MITPGIVSATPAQIQTPTPPANSLAGTKAVREPIAHL
jgi:hypothetical protein